MAGSLCTGVLVQCQDVGEVEGGLAAGVFDFDPFEVIGLRRAQDGIDGLAGSLCAAFMFMLCAAALYAGNELIANRANKG